jgi:hypothetical protein
MRFRTSGLAHKGGRYTREGAIRRTALSRLLECPIRAESLTSHALKSSASAGNTGKSAPAGGSMLHRRTTQTAPLASLTFKKV